MVEKNTSDSETDHDYELERAIVEAEAACNDNVDGENSDSHSEDDGIRNLEALQRAIQSTSYPDKMPWIESLTITHTKPIDCADASDDLDREVKLCVFSFVVLSLEPCGQLIFLSQLPNGLEFGEAGR